MTGYVVTGVFDATFALGPVATLTTANGGIVLASDLTSGTLTAVKVPRTVTATVPAQDRRQTTYATRPALRYPAGAGARHGPRHRDSDSCRRSSRTFQQ